MVGEVVSKAAWENEGEVGRPDIYKNVPLTPPKVHLVALLAVSDMNKDEP